MNGQQIDTNIVRLVTVMNTFQGITTLGSCGGHPAPRPNQWPEGEWYIQFEVDHSEHGWFALEFITWVITDYVRSGHNVTLYPVAPPPYLSTPGTVLSFVLEGHGGEDPEALAAWMNKTRERYYISPAHRARMTRAERSLDSFQAAPDHIRQAEAAASKRVRPWQERIGAGDHVVLQGEDDPDGFIFGEIVADEDPDAPPIPKHRRWVRCYAPECPDGEYRFIHVSEIIGIITPAAYAQAQHAGWPAGKDELLALVGADPLWRETWG